MFKKITIPLLLLFVLISPVFLTGQTKADEDTSTDSGFTYVFHLYYDGNNLFADRDVKFKYDIIAEPFEMPALRTDDPYRGDIVNFRNSILASFGFDASLVKGRLLVKGPYFADAAKVNFYNDSDQLLLTLNVSESSFCNDNGVCESDSGEDFSNCSIDCKLKPPPSVTPIPTGVVSNNLLIIIIPVVIAVAVLVGWLIIKKRRSREQIPPQVPPQVGSPPQIGINP